MGLTVKERFKALGEGKKLRKSNWGNGECIEIVGGDLTNQTVDEDWSDVINWLTSTHITSNWEIYEEPKLEITAKDVGRVAVFKCGTHSLILSFVIDSEYPVKTNYAHRKGLYLWL